MNLLEHTLYINLDRRTDRLQHVQKQLEIMGISGERFSAIATKVGSIGCTLSHIKCLEIAKERNYAQVFICEDDILFLAPEVLKASLAEFAQNQPDQWDVLLIGGNNVPPYEKVSEHFIKVTNCQTTTGYIVNQHYYDVLITNFRQSVENLIRNPKNHKEFALDMYWKQLQRQDNWFLLVPLTVVQQDSYSDIENRKVDYRHLMLDLDKEWLFRRRV